VWRTSGGAGAGGITIFGAGGTITGRLTTGGAMAGFSTCGGVIGALTTGVGFGAIGGAATASFRCVIAFKTSPGREMFDRSILVLISSSPRAPRDPDRPDADDPSAERM
jgi:hypothetical protein